MEAIAQIHEEYRTSIQEIIESWVTKETDDGKEQDGGSEDAGQSVEAPEDQVPEVHEDVRDDREAGEAHQEEASGNGVTDGQ